MTSRLIPPSFSRMSQLRLYLVLISVVLTLMIIGIFAYLYHLTETAMDLRLKDQASSYTDLLNHTKAWNLALGGVYALKQENDPIPRYLESFGIDPAIRSADGKIYTVKNHAIMLSEISRQSERSLGASFRLVALEPIDPRNSPDPLEQEALSAFSRGERTYSRLLADTSPQTYRMLTPLIADGSCSSCHPGKKRGEVIGAISLTIPAADVIGQIRTTRTALVTGAAGILTALLTIVYILTWRLSNQLDAVNLKLHRQATTDELTGLMNRRKIMRRLEEEFSRSSRVGEPLSLIIFDIDHFKRINDSCGHQFGDMILTRVSELMQATVRDYDLVGRIGGEEFLVVTPSTSLEDALAIAERIRERIASERIGNESRMVHVTISGGISTMNQREESLEAMIRRADDALYRAKNGGRNRVITECNGS